MQLLKKLAFTLFIIFFLVSILKDLTVGTVVSHMNRSAEQTEQPESSNDEERSDPVDAEQHTNNDTEEGGFDSIRIYPSPGDTVLSIVEELNPDSETIKMEQIIADFVSLNPDADPHQIKSNSAYYFPVYKNSE